MKHIPSILLFLLFLIPAAFAADSVTIKASEVTNHIGERVKVRGIVSDVFSGHFHHYRRNVHPSIIHRICPDELWAFDRKSFLESFYGKKIYRRKLGLTQPISATEFQEFKAYLDQNVKGWKNKYSEEIWRFFPKFRQSASKTNYWS